MNNQLSPIIVQPDQGKDLHAFGNILSVMLNGRQTGGMLAIMSELTPPGGGPKVHLHHREDEIFLVAEGRLSYYVEGEWTEVDPGGVVYIPKGVKHCFRNVGTVPSRHWIITTPSGFELFFARCADEFSKNERPSDQSIVEIHRDYGIELFEE